MTRSNLPHFTDELRMRLSELDSVERGLHRNMRLAAFGMREDFAEPYLDYLYLETKFKDNQNLSQREMENLACLKVYVYDTVHELDEKLVSKVKLSSNEEYFVDMCARAREVSDLVEEVETVEEVDTNATQSLCNKIDLYLQSVYEEYPQLNDWENCYVND